MAGAVHGIGLVRLASSQPRYQGQNRHEVSESASNCPKRGDVIAREAAGDSTHNQSDKTGD